MTITEVRVKLAADATERLLAFCSLTLEGCFVVRDLKLIRGANGPFVAMPSRKITARCGDCAGKNPLAARYCGECGVALTPAPDDPAEDLKARRYADIAHPINARCREQVQAAVVAAVERERVLASQPGYVCRYDEQDFGEPPPATAPAPPRVPAGETRRVDAAESPRPVRARAAGAVAAAGFDDRRPVRRRAVIPVRGDRRPRLSAERCGMTFVSECRPRGRHRKCC